jgi:hypothetical protein
MPCHLGSRHSPQLSRRHLPHTALPLHRSCHQPVLRTVRRAPTTPQPRPICTRARPLHPTVRLRPATLQLPPTIARQAPTSPAPRFHQAQRHLQPALCTVQLLQTGPPEVLSSLVVPHLQNTLQHRLRTRLPLPNFLLSKFFHSYHHRYC